MSRYIKGECPVKLHRLDGKMDGGMALIKERRKWKVKVLNQIFFFKKVVDWIHVNQKFKVVFDQIWFSLFHNLAIYDILGEGCNNIF